VEVVTAGQNGPPDAADVLLGTVHRKLVETFQGQELLLWHWEEEEEEEEEEDTHREALGEDLMLLMFP